MKPKHSELLAFFSVASHLNFKLAAVEREMSSSAISHALRGLERDLGVRLVNRTTRSVSLTEAGTLLFQQLKPALGQIDHAIEMVNGFRETPLGRIRLNAPRSVGLILLGPVMAALVRDNPGLSLEVSSDDRLVDIVAHGFDAGIRFGERLAQGVIAVRIGLPVSFAVVASPDYLKRNGRPASPLDLKHHSCVRYRFPSGTEFPWEFERDGHPVQVTVDGPITSDDQELMIEAALNGLGLAYVFADRVRDHVASGRLVRCMNDWCPTFKELFLYYPDRHHVPAGLRALIDLLKKPPRNGTAPVKRLSLRKRTRAVASRR